MLARTVGRPLAERVIAHEMGGEGGHEAGPIARQLAGVKEAIEQGGPLRQFSAVALLRLTPVVPFSASNYVLGLTPISLPAFLGGTVAGMSVWAVLYASLGGASRALLDRGIALDVLMAGGWRLLRIRAACCGGSGGIARWWIACTRAAYWGASTTRFCVEGS